MTGHEFSITGLTVQTWHYLLDIGVFLFFHCDTCRIIHPTVCLYNYFIFHTDGFKYKDTEFKYVHPSLPDGQKIVSG